MPGIEDVQPKQISTLGQPLAPTVEPAATVSSAAILLDQVRKGAIHPLEVMQRQQQLNLGEQQLESGANQLQLQRQQVSEALSPEAIQARAATMKLAKQKAEAEEQTMFTKNAVETWMKLRGDVVRDAEGNPDLDATARSGEYLIRMMQLQDWAAKKLKTDPQIFRDPQTGAERVRPLNADGENPFLEDGKPNPVFKEYRQAHNLATKELLTYEGEKPFAKKAGTVTPPTTPAETPTVVPEPTAVPTGASMVTPISPPSAFAPPEWVTPVPSAPDVRPNDALGWLVNQGALSQEEAFRLTPEQAVSIYKDYTGHLPQQQAGTTIQTPDQTITVQPKQAPPAAPPVKPTITPPAPPPAAPPTGAISGMGYSYPKEPVKVPEALKDMRTDAQYKDWGDKKSAINQFKALSQKARTTGVTNIDDKALGAVMRQFLTPGAQLGGRGMTEFMGPSLEHGEPLTYKLEDLYSEVTKRHAYSPALRKDLIRVGNILVPELERLGKNAIDRTVTSLRAQGVQAPLDQLGFDRDEIALAGQPTTGVGQPGTPTTGQKVFLPGRGWVIINQ